jgi:hypothetical protein
MRRSLTVLLTLSLTVPSFAPESQESLDPGVLAPGTRVRVKTYGRDRLPGMPGRLVGRIATADREALTLDLNANQRVSVPVRAIERVEVSAGRHSRWRGALIGAGIGALLVGGISGIALATSDDDSWEEVGAGVGLVYVTPLAALAVGAVGALASPGERWENVPRERLRVTAGPIFRRDGVGVGLSVSF